MVPHTPADRRERFRSRLWWTQLVVILLAVLVGLLVVPLPGDGGFQWRFISVVVAVYLGVAVAFVVTLAVADVERERVELARRRVHAVVQVGGSLSSWSFERAREATPAVGAALPRARELTAAEFLLLTAPRTTHARDLVRVGFVQLLLDGHVRLERRRLKPWHRRKSWAVLGAPPSSLSPLPPRSLRPVLQAVHAPAAATVASGERMLPLWRALEALGHLAAVARDDGPRSLRGLVIDVLVTRGLLSPERHEPTGAGQSVATEDRRLLTIARYRAGTRPDGRTPVGTRAEIAAAAVACGALLATDVRLLSALSRSLGSHPAGGESAADVGRAVGEVLSAGEGPEQAGADQLPVALLRTVDSVLDAIVETADAVADLRSVIDLVGSPVDPGGGGAGGGGGGGADGGGAAGGGGGGDGGGGGGGGGGP